MLIRVRPDLYINTEQIVSVVFYDLPSDYRPYFKKVEPPASYHGPCALLHCANQIAYEVSQEAARFVCMMMEATEAALLPEDKDSEPEQPTLKTRIAQTLRDTWKGATLGQLDAVFPDAGILAITAALAELEAEHTVVNIAKVLADNSALRLYYHTSSSEAQAILLYRSQTQQLPTRKKQATPSPDPSSEVVTQPDASRQAAEHNES